MTQGIIAGVVAALIWALIEAGRHAWLNRKHFARPAGRYSIHPKFDRQSDLGNARFAQIRVSGTILQVSFEGMPEGDSVEGEIAMSESFPRSGERQYQHSKAGVPLWGFRKVQVKSPGILLVHHMYARRDATLVSQGFLWERCDVT
jgi:hypothetical protein